jgi:hypothetical protein
MKYAVCLSFAGEDREYVSRVAATLKKRKVEVFYDRFETVQLWGKNLYTHLDEIYRREARFCVMFISKSYVEKAWTAHERESAQARAFIEPAEYILPARFDDTEVPGLRPTVGYVDLRTISAEDFAELICKKLQDTMFFADDISDQPGFSWFTNSRDVLDMVGSSVLTYQHIPIRIVSERIVEAASKLIRRLVSDVRGEGDILFWSHEQDRKFDRIYATTSVLYSVCQLGVDHNNPLVSKAIAYLKQATTPSIDDRAGSIYLMLVGQLSPEALNEFLRNVAAQQIRSESSGNYGSFLLEQGPTQSGANRAHWPRPHRDGASFHACHIADALLHIPSWMPACREQAEPILSGIREFMVSSFAKNDGWLHNREDEKTSLTLYSYALCPALHIPLPRNCKEVGEECNRIAAGPVKALSNVSLVL